MKEQLQHEPLTDIYVVYGDKSAGRGTCFRVFIERGSKIVKEHLRNEIGGVIEYTGTAPTYATPCVPPAGAVDSTPSTLCHLIQMHQRVAVSVG